MIYLKGAVHVAITAMMSISEIVPFVLITYFALNETDGNNMLFLWIVGISKVIYCIMLVTLFKATDKENITYDHDGRKTTFIFLIIMVVTLLLSGSLIYVCLSLNIAESYFSLLIAIMFIILLNFLVFLYSYSIKVQYEDILQNRLLHQQENDLIKYNTEINELTSNQRIALHDIKNHLITIEEMSQRGNAREITDYIKNILDEPEFNKRQKFCSNTVLNMVLCRYSERFQKENIDFSFNIFNPVLEKIKSTDLTALMCNLLDNASEAASGISGGYIFLNIQRGKNTAYTVIKVVNTCLTEPPADAKGKLRTSKNDSSNHGIGTKSIQRICERYNGYADFFYDSEKKEFHSVVLMENV
ncbi:MAG: GHKL domain-containing protein [Lachnospiraceae bacterium]|nr:GHKL domain-containing protein [Lachnospiraceae bacterium]